MSIFFPKKYIFNFNSRENSEHIRFSNNIALLILDRLDQSKWTQKQLAEEMGVSPQQVSKWVKGGENLTISTIINISNALGFNLIRLNMC